MNTLKNIVKKAIAVGSGAVMLGATTAGALADLSDYPAPFIENGQFNGLIVVGENAASSDIIGAIDIAASLQASATTPVMDDGGATRTVLTGDVAQIGDSGDVLEIGEYIGAVTETLSEDDLEMLQSGTITTQAGTTDFTQTLDLDVSVTANHAEVQLTENNDDETGTFLLFQDGSDLFTYEIEFTSGLESDVEDQKAVDLEDESIYLLGQWYSVIDTDMDANGGALELELLAGQVSDTLTVGETKTYEIDGAEYEVTVLAVGNDGTAVKFLVNGEATDSMGDGDTDTLADGLEIGVRDVIETTAYRESDPGSLVEFYLGANKVTLPTAGDVEINNENIDDLTAAITYTDTVATGDGDLRINSISLTLASDSAGGSDIFLAAGDSLRENLDEPEGMLGTWDITFAGLSEPDTTAVEFEAVGDDQYDLVFTNNRGTEFSVPLYSAAGNQFGDDTDEFVFYENAATANATNQPDEATEFLIEIDSYFVVTDVGAAGMADNNDNSYVLRFSDVDEDDTTVTFENVADGSEIVATYSEAGLADIDTVAEPATGAITIGGKDFSFWLYDAGSDVYHLAVDLDDDGAITDDVVDIVAEGGLIITPATFAQINTATGATAAGVFTTTLTTLGEDLDSDNLVSTDVGFTDSGTDVDISSVAAGSTNVGAFFSQAVDDEDRTVYLNEYGTWMEKTDETEESDSLVISYPTEQVEALVYVVGGDAQSSTSTTGGAGARVNPISVGSAVLDKDVQYDQDNMIVVGGPCVNTMAAQLLQNPADCTEGFEAGHAMIQLFDTGNNVALLVAGFEAQDTVGASRVLAEYSDYELMGDSADVVVESLRDIRVE